MAKKKTTKKKHSSKPSKGKSVSRSKKTTAGDGRSTGAKKKKNTSKKSAPGSKKKAAAKKTGKKSTGKKKTSKKPTAKKTAAKKRTTKKKVAVKKTTAGKKKTANKKTTTRRKKSAAEAKAAGSSPSNGFREPKPGSLDGHSNGQQQLSDAQMRKVKTGLTKKDLTYFRQLLLEKRAEIVGDVASMDLMRNGGGGELSHMPLHMADVGSDHYEQEFTLGLVESERRLLREIDDALMRIVNRTYGVCVISGKPIGKARLEVQPWAKYCIEVARERERGR